ncbi:ABC-type Na+ efflux pump, permease component [Clostridium collagenovorans DSM 3089]|uniref:ABC-type Na+ efflux pump, permease component n=1 Tax=Clostridium collagenovorans DSM 3089 TaxID=1121306 RepID=A0A1M5YFP7_9CLOT|nr:ABC transporter permease subunit [Clostridium collagenovorans]SHI10865.1 ABC-type Na+ efflux pump, permease component [Clostridium collagenovorans DSM 3089]
MWVLIKHELKRFFKSKISLISIVLILVLNIFLGVNYKNEHKAATWEVYTNYAVESLETSKKSLQEKLDYLNTLNSSTDITDDIVAEKKATLSHIENAKNSLLTQDQLVTALKDTDKRKYLELDLASSLNTYKKDLERIKNHTNSTEPKDLALSFLNLIMKQYVYDNNLMPQVDIKNNYSSLDLLMNLLKNYYILILPILFLIFASTSISGEISNNTCKLLFSQPIKKHKIITSKIISSFIISLFFILLVSISTIIIGTILNSFGELNYPVLMFENFSGKAIEPYSILEYTHIEPTKIVLMKLISYFLLVALFINSMAILISSLFKSKLTSIISSIIIFVGTYFTAPIITGIKAFNPMTYLSSYEIVTGISSLTEPKVQLTLGIILLSSLLVIFTVLSALNVKKLHP